MAAASPSKRRDIDVMKLMMSDFKVHIPDESRLHDFCVLFKGPAETPYEGGRWRVHVTLPSEYPFKSPSIGFMNRLYHPNVDEMSGSVCLDVINQTWSPMFDLVNIFEVFLPQLLRYPNPNDPLNGEAANLLLRDADKYSQRVRDYVRKFASQEILMDTEWEEEQVKKPRSSSFPSSTASTDTAFTTPNSTPGSSPALHPLAGPLAGASASSAVGSGSSGGSTEEADDGNDSDVSELSDIDI